MLQCSTKTWSTDASPVRADYAAWCEQLNDIYGLGSSWQLDSPRSTDFSASVAQGVQRDFRIVECRCDPCGAVRTQNGAREMERDVLAIQLTLSGQEVMTIGDETIELNAGDILAWDAAQEMRFDVINPLHKITLMMPLWRLKSWMPKAWRIGKHKFRSGSIQADLFSSYLSTIKPGFMSGHLSNVDGLTEATVGLLINALGENERKRDDSLSDAQMARVMNFIERHICDPNLSPSMIASGCRISIRYLHLLFEPTEETALQFVIRRRLALCRRELSNPHMASRSITDIALSFGFNSANHFSRRFKEEFGMAPKDYRSEVGLVRLR